MPAMTTIRFEISVCYCLSLGCSEYQTVWLINGNLSLPVLDAVSLRSGCQHGWVLVRAGSLIADGHFLIVSSHGREQRALWGLFYKTSGPTTEGSTLMS